MNFFWWSMYQDHTPIPEFGHALPVKPITNVANVLVASVAATTVLSLVLFPDGSPTWWYVVRFFVLTFAAQASIQWTRHLVTNLRLRQRRPIFGKNMAFFGWFLPPFIPILPALQFSELARKSAPPGRTSAGSQLLVFVWFVTAIAWAGTQFVAFQYWIDATEALPQDDSLVLNTTPREWLVYAAFTQVLGALAYIAMTRSIRQQHEAFLAATAPPTQAEVEARAESLRAGAQFAAPPPSPPPYGASTPPGPYQQAPTPPGSPRPGSPQAPPPTGSRPTPPPGWPQPPRQ